MLNPSPALAYVVKSESQRMLFVWSGADVLEQSLKAATAHAADLAKSMEDNMMIVQVAQGKETEEFSKVSNFQLSRRHVSMKIMCEDSEDVSER